MATPDVQLRPRESPRVINRTQRHTVVVGLKQSKFRHVAVTSGGKEGTFINLRQVNTRLRPESNGFCINDRWAAVPLSVAGGVVAVFDTNKPTKVADGVIPGLENGANVADFAWDPFRLNTLAVGCDNGMIHFWNLPEEGVYSVQTNPTKSLKAHNDRINVMKFNPLAENVLATAASNGTVTIWDTGAMEPKIQLDLPASPILAMNWTTDGKYLAVITRDGYLRVFEPRANTAPILESSVLETPKGARVLYVCNDRFILTSSLTKSSQRTINLYSAKTLSLIHSHPLDTSSSLLIPHYDFDSSVLFLTGKGDRTIQMFEICDDAPYFLQLSAFVAPTSHQAIAFTSKNSVDVRKVEFARGARLLLSEMERMTFKVPRVKMDMFQNDLFPPALVTWEPVTNASEWFDGVNIRRKFSILKPNDMEPLYRDMFVFDIARQASVQDAPPDSAGSGILYVTAMESPPEEPRVDRNGNTAEIETERIVLETTPVTSPTIKKISDGLGSWPPAENGVHSSNANKAIPPQPKRLSIDPNSGTPFRDLLRRCDEIPGVIAMRHQSDSMDDTVEPKEDEKEWE